MRSIKSNMQKEDQKVIFFNSGQCGDWGKIQKVSEKLQEMNSNKQNIWVFCFSKNRE